MVTPSTASTSSDVLSPAARAAGLEAQIQQYQKVLSECVNCSSAATPEGKANIDALASKITSTRARIAELAAPDARPPVQQPAAGQLNLNQPGPNNGNFISTVGSVVNIISS